MGWSVTRARLSWSVTRVRTVTALAAGIAVLGLVLLVAVRDSPAATTAGGLACAGGAGVALGFGINLVWWARMSRVLRSAPWQPAEVRIRPTPTWWSRNQDDVLLDDDQPALADLVMCAGDLSPLSRTIGFEVDPAPRPALVAGVGRFRVLTTRTGGLLLPLREPRSTRQHERWLRRWRDRRVVD